MELPLWVFIIAIIGTFLVGCGAALYTITYLLVRAGMLEDLNRITELHKQRNKLTEQLGKNQVFLDSMAIKDGRARKLMISNQRIVNEIADNIEQRTE